MNEPRHGQWVRFALPIRGAHRTASGHAVGIYQRGRVLQDGRGGESFVPAHVAVVRPDGQNLMRLADDGNHTVKVALAPGDCPGLGPAVVPDDLPRCHRNADLFGE